MMNYYLPSRIVRNRSRDEFIDVVHELQGTAKQDWITLPRAGSCYNSVLNLPNVLLHGIIIAFIADFKGF
jgi:hypothetical protein